MTTRDLQTLVTLVNQKEINLIGFYYPTVSPILKLKWTAIYQDKNINEFAFGEFDTFLMACSRLAVEVLKSAALSESNIATTDSEVLVANSYLQKTIEFINSEIAKSVSPVWLLGLEYNSELRDTPMWIGTIEGDVYLEMQMTEEDARLSVVCKKIYDAIVNFTNS